MLAGWRSVRVGAGRRNGAWHGAGTALLLALATTAWATPSSANPDQQPSGREIWAGADISKRVWLVYSGMTYAPWSGMHDDGWRFRTVGGYGEYEYDGNDRSGPAHFEAETYFADFLVGYLKRFGELTAKGFVGASIVSHDISPLDPETVAIGEEVGVKGVIELWLNIGENAWGSLDLSWSSAHDSRAARARLGYRVWPKLSLGLEGGINVDSQGECRMDGLAGSGCRSLNGDPIAPTDLLDYARAGGFVRYEWDRSEVSLSAGVLGDSFGTGDDDIELAPYVTLNWLTQF
jgi:hypothetical protein